MSGILSQKAAKKSNISLRELIDVNENGNIAFNTRPDNIEHNMVLTSYNIEGRAKEFVFKNLTDLIKPGTGVTIVEVNGVLTLSSTGGGGVGDLDQVTTLGNITNNTIDVGGVKSNYFLLDTTATPTPVQGMMFWDTDRSTVGVQLNGVEARLGQDNFWYVKNQSGSSIPKGKAVMAVGTLGSSGRILIDEMVANGSVSAKFLLGVTAETIANGSDGFVMNIGKIRQLNTSMYADGDTLYCDPTTPGNLTNVAPASPNLKLPVAFVVHSASNGTIAVRSTKGCDLYENHRVEINTSNLNNRQTLSYNTASGRWENSGDFDFSLNFEAANPYTIILPYDFSIDTVDDPGSITYTITVNALPYTLGNTINAQDIVEVTPGAIGWINLNCTRLT